MTSLLRVVIAGLVPLPLALPTVNGHKLILFNAVRQEPEPARLSVAASWRCS